MNAMRIILSFSTGVEIGFGLVFNRAGRSDGPEEERLP